jgi:hypothetical protein
MAETGIEHGKLSILVIIIMIRKSYLFPTITFEPLIWPQSASLREKNGNFKQNCILRNTFNILIESLCQTLDQQLSLQLSIL